MLRWDRFSEYRINLVSITLGITKFISTVNNFFMVMDFVLHRFAPALRYYSHNLKSKCHANAVSHANPILGHLKSPHHAIK